MVKDLIVLIEKFPAIILAVIYLDFYVKVPSLLDFHKIQRFSD